MALKKSETKKGFTGEYHRILIEKRYHVPQVSYDEYNEEVLTTYMDVTVGLYKNEATRRADEQAFLDTRYRLEGSKMTMPQVYAAIKVQYLTGATDV